MYVQLAICFCECMCVCMPGCMLVCVYVYVCMCIVYIDLSLSLSLAPLQRDPRPQGSLCNDRQRAKVQWPNACLEVSQKVAVQQSSQHHVPFTHDSCSAPLRKVVSEPVHLHTRLSATRSGPRPSPTKGRCPPNWRCSGTRN